jgi:hypothetical protein
MSTAENIQTMQAFLGYFNPAEARRMAQGGGAQFSGKGKATGGERIQTLQAFLGYFNPAEANRMARGGGAQFGGKGKATGAERIQTLQAFLGYFNPSEARRMARGGGVRLGGKSEAARVDPSSTPKGQVVDQGQSGMSTAERIRTMQAFLGHFNPAQAKRMAQGGGARLDAESEAGRVDPVSALTDHVAEESFLRSLSALQDAFPNLEVVIENSTAKGDQVAIRFAVASH